MKKKDYLSFFIIELIILLVVGLFQKTPGYMDAEYYFSGGQRLVHGYGFSENFLWNYLDDPQGIPHPSHGYWMPMASILAAMGMVITISTSFAAGKIFFVLLSSAVPPLSALLSYQINGRRDYALFSGIVATIPGFYLSYMGTTDTFGLLMVLGALYFLLMGNGTPQFSFWRVLLTYGGMGIITGLMHLSRVDGILWFFISFVFIFIGAIERRKNDKLRSIFVSSLYYSMLCFAGYCLIMAPWMARNYKEFGSLLSPGGIRSLWITNYNELYIYPSSLLNFWRWMNSGINEIIKSRLSAGWINIQSMIAVEGMIFLTPLIIWGFWKNRSKIQLKIAFISWSGVFVIMTAIFPYQGARGGFFHSSAALQPILWAMAPLGFDAFISWGTRVRHWNYLQAYKIFKMGVVGLACMICIVVVFKRVVGPNLSQPVWNKDFQYYLMLEKEITQRGVLPGEIVMVNNPPGYYLASLRPCVVIPDGGIEQVVQVAQRYHARYLILEYNHPMGLDTLYLTPQEQAELEYLFSYNKAHVFRLIDGT